MPHCTCGNQTMTCKSQASPSTMWAPESLYPLNHLCSLVEETQTELLETLDKDGRILEVRPEEARQVPQTSNAQEKDALSDCVQEAKASLQEATKAKMNKVDGSILSRLYKNHIQDYGSPGPFWEQELESLHHVIEMKNERIHELEKQLLLLEMLVPAEARTRCQIPWSCAVKNDAQSPEEDIGLPEAGAIGG
ncbi:coiled-coil domain-containing protein 69 isoform X3 [Arvicanthis niloticus]|uniref:coiled-coil domain-containing protein 69 isoform X3 n=1 Tax=Arvicanthis niloticus TaxID=61156 RepID=UPI00402B46C8